jgi:hypothetical protein
MELTANSDPQVMYLDYDGFDRAGLDLIVGIMKNYEKWAIDQLDISYTPTTNKTVSGSVAFAPDFDPLDVPSTSAMTMSVSDYFRSGSISDPMKTSIRMPYARKSPEDMLYVAPNSEPRLTSNGFLNFLVDSDLDDTTIVGYVELSYVIRFYLKTPATVSLIDGNDRDVIISNNGSNERLVFDGNTAFIDSINASATQDVRVGVYCSAIIDAITEGELIDNRGKTVPAGSRIFLQAAQLLTDLSTGTSTLNTGLTSFLSKFALDRNFNDTLTWVGSSDLDGGFSLNDVRYIL